MSGEKMSQGTDMSDANWPPLVICVAPNGARKTQADHPALPISPQELADCAADCVAQGASMIHLHVRDEGDGHSLDVGRYRDAIAAVRARLGDDIVIQATTEAVGIYTPDQQMAMVRELRPEAASLAIREIVPEGGEATAADFLSEIMEAGVRPQFILYSADDLQRYEKLCRDGVIPGAGHFLLFVLGRYTAGQQSDPRDILPFLAAPFLTTRETASPWAVCAFGAREQAAAMAASALGGHVRVGFENNMQLADGTPAPDNAALVAQVRRGAENMGRAIATARDVRAMTAGM